MKRREAKAQELKFYRTGKPCKHGHLSERYTSTGMCVDCIKIQSVEWRLENPEKHSQSMRKWLENNRALHKIRVKRWQAANKDKIKISAKAWQQANPEKVNAIKKRWVNKNPAAYTANAVAGVAKRAKRIPKWLTIDDKWMLREAYSLAKLRTKMFGFVWEVDHIIPLRGNLVSGLHVPTNVRVIPKIENRNKRNKYEI